MELGARAAVDVVGYGLWQLPNCVGFTWGSNPGARDEFWGHLALVGKGLGWGLTQLLLHRE